ncbi:DUF924 family protein [Aliikangiella coralliicola]|uniref:DUF924 domain-containing protein n=1 Tax=Aliikangiella coralliicola TaxID=2592383 RepID=A0A545UI89_9GAMM|nr:DUF924 family protein [Aliikangiella coralliicola]TQV89181.1 DUF924 domain-containing protein [Aliikangiella coralliicola]
MLFQYSSVIDFWFQEIEPKFWFIKDDAFDETIRTRFIDIYHAAISCELASWRVAPEGRLAEIIVIDQFSRNMFRDSAQAFAFDSLAVALTQEAVAGGHDQQLPVQQRKFLYMPLMHSESLIVHEQAEKLFSQPGLEDNYQYEIKHKVIIEKFGRYPHRNQVLNRESTEAEIEFLKQPGSSF